MSEVKLSVVVIGDKADIPETARSVTARAAGGYLQVLPDHAPLLMLVLPGVVEVDPGKGRATLRYKTEKGGYLWSRANLITLVLKDIKIADEADANDFAQALDTVKREWDAGLLTTKR
jgi:F-type H+-transporting ATPase subunit epsilon